jgi:hypothetical protein
MKLNALLCPILCLGSLIVSVSAVAAPLDDAIDLVDSHAKKGDDIAVRLLVKRLRSPEMTPAQWARVRAILHSRPGAGWDLMRAWDRTKRAPPPAQVDRDLAVADRLIMAKRFGEAFDRYQSIAQQIKRDIDASGKPELAPNKFLYYSVLHMMGIALYGAGRFEEADKVLRWIPPLYPNFRDVLYQRMWAGFRADRIDLSLGAIASQYSSYFANSVDPETYLVQIYVYRKLCRNDDLAMAQASAKRFYGSLKNGSLTYKEWARSDFETLALLNLVEKGVEVTSSQVGAGIRAQERLRIEGILKKRFKEERVKLLPRMEKVMAYVNLALSSTSKELPPVRQVPTASELISSGLEMWPVEDAEDWIDELGHHVFGGGSQCQAR